MAQPRMTSSISVRGKLRDATEGAGDGGSGEVVGAGGAEGAARGFADGGADCGGDDDFIHKSVPVASSQLLVAEGFAGFEGEGDAFLGLLCAAQGEEGFAFEVEEVLLADGGAGGELAAAEDVGGPVGDLGVVLGDEGAFAEGPDGEFQGGEGVFAGGGDVGARRGCGVAGVGEGWRARVWASVRRRSRFRVTRSEGFRKPS